MATIADIAKKTGLGYSTVAQIVQGRRNYRPRTIELVMNAAEELGYIPNYLSKSLVGSKSNLIGVFLESSISSPATALIYPIDKIGRQNGYSTFISAGGNKDSETILELKKLLGYKIEGLIYHSTSPRSQELIDFLRNITIPIVFLDRAVIPNHPALVKLCYENALNEMADYLAAHGHRRAQLLLDEFFIRYPERLIEPYRTALNRVNIEVIHSSDWCYPCDEFFEEPAYKLTMRHLQAGERPPLLMAFNDEVAIGAMAAIRDFGLDIPGDISVVGRDGIAFGQYLRPALASIARPDPRDIAGNAFHILHQMMTTPDFIPTEVRLKMQFVPGTTIADFILN